MKGQRNGKTYDTDKSECIGSYTNNLPQNDFKYYREDLFKTGEREYFLCGEGGAMSKYRRTMPDNSSGYGSGIIVLSAKQAEEYIKIYLDKQ